MLFRYTIEPYYRESDVYGDPPFVGFYWYAEEVDDITDKPIDRDRFGTVRGPVPFPETNLSRPSGYSNTKKKAQKKAVRAIFKHAKKIQKLQAKFGRYPHKTYGWVGTT